MWRWYNSLIIWVIDNFFNFFFNVIWRRESRHHMTNSKQHHVETIGLWSSESNTSYGESFAIFFHVKWRESRHHMNALVAFWRSSLLWRCRRSFAQIAFEADSGTVSRCMRACRTRFNKALRIVHFFHELAPARQRLAAGRTVFLATASTAPGTGACMIWMVRTVLNIHVRQAQVDLPRLPQSNSKASLAKLLLHRHPSEATQNISNVPEIQENTKKVARTESGTVAISGRS